MIDLVLVHLKSAELISGWNKLSSSLSMFGQGADFSFVGFYLWIEWGLGLIVISLFIFYLLFVLPLVTLYWLPMYVTCGPLLVKFIIFCFFLALKKKITFFTISFNRIIYICIFLQFGKFCTISDINSIDTVITKLTSLSHKQTKIYDSVNIALEHDFQVANEVIIIYN